MKFFTITVITSILSVAMAREVYVEHPRALERIHKRGLTVLSRRQSGNLATFTGALGGIAPTAITCSGDSKRQFEVAGDTFVNFAAAAQRSCDKQHNACANAANAGGQSFSVSDCSAQQSQCNTEQTAAAGTCDGTTAVAGSNSTSSATTAAAVAAVATSSASCGSSTTTTTAAATATCASAKRRRNVGVQVAKI